MDFLMIITDGYLTSDDLNAKAPPIDVYWIITSGSHDFKPNFGKVFSLKNE